MTTLILMIVATYIVRTGARKMSAKVFSAGHIATETLVQYSAEPQDWGPYGMPTFLRKEGEEASRLRRDLAEFRKDLDGSADDWIDRLIRRQIAAQSPV